MNQWRHQDEIKIKVPCKELLISSTMFCPLKNITYMWTEKYGLKKGSLSYGMSSKLIPLLSGSIGLVTCCTIDGVVGTLLLVPIPQIQNLGVHI